MRSIRNALAVAVITGVCGVAQSAPLTVASYDMPNGSGTNSGGSFNYWDRSYTGFGSTITDGALLSGGTGDLTDGLITNQNWLSVENAAGTGPYVGWRSLRTPNPVVRFDFGGTAQVNTITVHMDDSNGLGGVTPPLSIDLSTDGISFAPNAIADPASGAPFSVTLPVNASTGQLFVRFAHRSEWLFIDEVSFDGVPSSVPEPGTLALLGLGLAGLAAARRRRR